MLFTSVPFVLKDNRSWLALIVAFFVYLIIGATFYLQGLNKYFAMGLIVYCVLDIVLYFLVGRRWKYWSGTQLPSPALEPAPAPTPAPAVSASSPVSTEVEDELIMTSKIVPSEEEEPVEEQVDDWPEDASLTEPESEILEASVAGQDFLGEPSRTTVENYQT